MAEYTILLSTELKAALAERGIDRIQRKVDKLKNTFRTAFGGAGAGGVRGGARPGARAGRAATGVTGGGAFAIRGIATEVGAAVQGLTIALAALSGAMILVSRQAINMSAEFEVLKVTFETLTGSVEIADELIRDLKEFAVKTPLQLRDIEQAATVLLGLGEAADDVIPILTTLGQAAAALNKPLEQFIRVRNLLSQGVILTRALTPLGVSREQLGDILDIKDLAEASGEELVSAFDTALGRFAGLFQRTFDTVRGRLSNLKDVFDVTFAAIGDPAREIIIQTVDTITAAFDRVRAFFEENKVAVQNALKIIRDSIANFLAPAVSLLDKFFTALEEKPQLLNDVARGIVVFTNSLIGLVIFGTITAGILNFFAAVTLLRISLPQLTATFAAFGGGPLLKLGPALIRGAKAFKIFGAAALSGGAAGVIARTAILRLVPAVILLTEAFKNLDNIQRTNLAAWKLLQDILGLVKIKLFDLTSVMDSINGLFFNFSRVITSVIMALQLAFEGASVLVEVYKTMKGETSELIERTKAFEETQLRLAALWGDSAAVAELMSRRLRELDEASGLAASGIDEVNAAIGGINTSGPIGQLNALIDSYFELSGAAMTAARSLLIASGLAVGPEGRLPAGAFSIVGPGGEPGPTIAPGRFEELISQGFTVGEIISEILSAAESQANKQLRELLGLGDGGGGRDTDTRKTKADVLAAQQAVIDRLAEENIARKDKLALWISIQDEAARAFKDKMIVFNEFQQEAIDQLAQRNMDRKDKFALAQRLELEELQAQKDKRARFIEAEELRLEQTDRIAKDFLDGLSRLFDQFIRSFGNISKVAGKGANQLLGLGGQALGASLFGKGGFATGGLFAKGALLGGLGPNIIAAGATMIAGGLINAFFGKEKAIEIEGPVDVNIVDIAVSALKIFNFRGFEGFTFTSRYRTVFQSGSY